MIFKTNLEPSKKKMKKNKKRSLGDNLKMRLNTDGKRRVKNVEMIKQTNLIKISRIH